MGDDGREERREGQRCERDGRCGGWLAREIMERCMEGREAGKGEGGEMNEARSTRGGELQFPLVFMQPVRCPKHAQCPVSLDTTSPQDSPKYALCLCA